MSANDAIELIGYGLAAPAAVAFAVWLALRRMLPSAVADACSPAWALAAGFVVGYVLLPSWAALVPSRHWHWLQYLAVIAAVLAPLASLPRAAGAAWMMARWAVSLVLAIAAAWFVVPTWASLEPPRSVWIMALAAYLFVLMRMLAPLADRVSCRLLLAAMSATAAALAAAIAAKASLRYGQLAMPAAAASAGCFAASWLLPATASVRALVPVYALVVGGLALVGAIEPDPPIVALLAVPAAPLVLWCVAVGPLARKRGAAAATVESGAT